MATIQDTTNMDVAVKKKRPTWVWILSGCVLIFLVVIVFNASVIQNWIRSDRSVQRSRIQMARVERGNLDIEVLVDGRIVAANHINLFSQDPGVVRLLKKEGQEVQEGETVALVSSPELESRRNQERSVLERLRSELQRKKIEAKDRRLEERQETERTRLVLETAQRNMERSRRSFEAGLVQEMKYEEAQDDLKLARLNFDHQKEKMDLVKETLNFEIQNSALEVSRQELVVSELERRVEALALKSPIKGLVGSLPVKDLDAVRASQPVATLVDLTHFEVEMDIPEAYGDRLSLGLEASVPVENRVLKGTITRISPEVIHNQIKGTVSFSQDIAEGLKQNQRVSVKVYVLSKSDVLKVHRGPFLEATGGNQIYVVKDDLARLQAIKTGVSSLKEVEILEGLEEGQEVIISDMTRFGSSQTLMINN